MFRVLRIPTSTARSRLSLGPSGKLLLVFCSTVILWFQARRDPWTYFSVSSLWPSCGLFRYAMTYRIFGSGRENCYWPSPAQSVMVADPVGTHDTARISVPSKTFTCFEMGSHVRRETGRNINSLLTMTLFAKPSSHCGHRSPSDWLVSLALVQMVGLGFLSLCWSLFLILVFHDEFSCCVEKSSHLPVFKTSSSPC